MKKSFNLAELQNNPTALNTILTSIKTKPAPKKEETANSKKQVKVKASKIKKKRPDTSHIIVLDRSEEKQAKKSQDKKEEVKVKYDDDTQTRINALDILLVNIESYFNQNSPLYLSMQTLLSSAYRYTTTQKMRVLVAETRDHCREALSNIEKKQKLKAQLKAKNTNNATIRDRLKKYSNTAINASISTNLETLKQMVDVEKKKQTGHAYDNLHEEYEVDLSEYEAKVDSIVMARADLMTTLSQPLDTERVNSKNAVFKHIEGPIYSIKNALVIGFRPQALPKKIMEETLEIAIAQTFGIKGVPVVKQLRHRSSNRVWFFLPEISIIVKTVMFADRALNSEFDMFKSMTNDPSEDDVRFIFLRAGVAENVIEDIVTRMKKSDSKRGRLTILHNAYVETKRRMKNERLKAIRESFLTENTEIMKDIKANEDRRLAIKEIKEQHNSEFSILASHTGREDQGLRISQVEHLNAAFDQIEAVAVRGNSSSYDRIQIRENIFQDKMKCRRIAHDYKSLTRESRLLKHKNASNKMILEINRKKAFHEISGEDELDDI